MRVVNTALELEHANGDSVFAARLSDTESPHDHTVQFYETDEYLIGLITGFVADGLNRGQLVVVVVSDDHARSVTQALHARGVDVVEESDRGSLLMLDAHQTLAGFMDGDRLDVDRFHATFAQLIQRTALHGAKGVRAYGEMVDVLSRGGNTEGAICLEELWSQLVANQNFALLCSYRLQSFRDAEQTVLVDRICKAHSRVRPTERFTERDDEARLVEIALLQQRAQALETELRRRETLETRLRDVLAASERAKSLAEHANRAKGHFLAVMSHELRTPLNAIGGYTELLDMGIHGPVNAEQRDALDRIQRSQRHLLGMINQVLNYAKVETGSLRYDFTEFPLDDVLRTVEALIGAQINARGLRYTHTGGELTVFADREKLQQILLNLVVNATKFTDADGAVTVECSANDSTVFLRVRDDGIGIASEKFAAIFEPFVQVESNRARTRDGMGLGLAISRDFARSMGGDLTVESVVGTGSVFTLALPRPAR